jgi:hypothetical protein
MKKIILVLVLVLWAGVANAIDIWDTRPTVTIAWDAVTGATSYKVWVKATEPEGVSGLRGEYTVTQAQLTFTEGKWLFGVSAKNAVGESGIAWSDNPAYTYLGKTYGINYVAPGIIPAIPSGLKLVSDITPPIQEVNLILNGDFEFNYVNGVAENWRAITDGGTYSFSVDTGHDGGLAQKMVVTAKNTWGMFYAQAPAFVLNQWYTVSFWYKTTAGGNFWTAVCNDPHTATVSDRGLPDTAGGWVFYTFDFQWTNSQAYSFRVSSSTPGSYWLDSVKIIVKR